MVKSELWRHKNTSHLQSADKDNTDLCDTVMGIYDSDNSDVGYKSVHMEDNGHYNTYACTDAVHIVSSSDT